MLSIFVAMALATAGDPVSTAAGAELTAANAWVSLIDKQRWAESWSEAGALFKSQVSQQGWASTVQPVRTPLGAVSSRALKSVTKATSLPGVPDGEYEVVQFRTSFEHKNDATETVVLAHESSGWRVNGYFIR
jgi:hypothetical protein